MTETRRTNHRLLRASAGTGKTYQLVQAYISEVHGRGRRPGEIVAITFTRKSALELRSRVRKGLASMGDRTLLAELAQAPISNFHGLALQLLRGFGFVADFAEGMEVLGEEGDARQLFFDACEDAWFSGDSRCAKAVEALAMHLPVDRGLPPALWQALSRAREDGRKIDGAALLGRYDTEKLQQTLHQRLLGVRERLHEVRGRQSRLGRASIDAFLQHPVPAIDSGVENWCAAWRDAGLVLDRHTTIKDIFTKDDKALFSNSLPATRAAALCNELIPHLTTLMDEAWRAYGVAKRARRAVDFADLIEGLISTLENRVDLHRSVRQRFKAVLVDEAQDTNHLQRRLVHLLAGLAGPAAKDTEPASLFIVGDRKQAIYTFRGADPEAFTSFTRDLSGLGGREEILDISRRSRPEVVASINSLGEQLFESSYEALKPLEQSDDEDRGPGMIWLEVPEEGLSAVPAAMREARAVAAYVRQQIDTGQHAGDFTVLLAFMSRAPFYAAALAERGIPAVLGGGGGLFEQSEIVDHVALLAWLTDGTDRLSAAVALRSPLIGLSESGLMALFGSADSSARLAALRSGDASGMDSGVPGDAMIVARLTEVLPQLVAAAEVMSPAELLEHIDLLLDVRAVLLALEGGEQKVANLDRLWELARTLDAKGSSATVFARLQLENIERGHKEPVVSVPAAARRAVSVTTVHQAKGLEFPVVVLADIRHKPRNDAGVLQYCREEGLAFRPSRRGSRLETSRFSHARKLARREADDELKRLLYVAVTRAQLQVVIVGTASAKSRKQGFAKLLDRWRPEAERQGVLVRQEANIGSPRPSAPQTAVPTDADGAWAETLVAHASARGISPGTSLALPVTTVDTFMQCLRRGFLVHDLGLPEPAYGDARLRWPADDDRDPPLDPLSRGRLAHEVLSALDRAAVAGSREGFVDAEIALHGYDPSDPRLADVRRDVLMFLRSSLGERLLGLGGEARRHEMPFRLAIAADPFVAVLHGQIDLLFWDEHGPMVLDYKHARGGPAGVTPFGMQLDAYALAVERLLGVAGDIRTSVVFLRGGGKAFDRLVVPGMRRELEANVAAVTRAIATLRGQDEPWPGRDQTVCEKLGCGFLFRCYPQAHAVSDATTSEALTFDKHENTAKRGQLSLF
ncbi:MAG: hypothetical protein A2289_05230 [Deltaproteobacteria bacterium RIFOXYA12_FULL_58_15]|nr:MAG: hypothetical protein A2289_05230 [Deltaproteobacteria bacterium RIFOXYA12_FULL_58_15]